MDTLLNIYNKYVKFIDSSDLTASTRQSYVNSIGQFCNFWGLHKDVSTLNDRSFDLFMQKLKGEGYSQQSLDSKSSAINNFAFFLNKKSLCPETIPSVSPKESLKKDMNKPNILSKEEVTKLKQITQKDIRSSAVINLLLHSGIKVGEIIDLKVNEFQLKGNVGKISLPGREIEITSEALHALLKYLAIRPKKDNRIFFISLNGKPLNIRNLRRQISRYFIRAGIKKASLFDLRHTFCVDMLKNGMPIYELAKTCGHKNLISAQKYLDLIDI